MIFFFRRVSSTLLCSGGGVNESGGHQEGSHRARDPDSLDSMHAADLGVVKPFFVLVFRRRGVFFRFFAPIDQKKEEAAGCAAGLSTPAEKPPTLLANTGGDADHDVRCLRLPVCATFDFDFCRPRFVQCLSLACCTSLQSVAPGSAPLFAASHRYGHHCFCRIPAESTLWY